jgi:hypothetical protein
LASAVTSAGAPSELAQVFSSTPATGALFGAFLGYNPVQTILNTLPPAVVNAIPTATIQHLTGSTFFPNAISSPFMTALREAFIVGAIMCFLTAVFSALRGNKYIHGQPETKLNGNQEQICFFKKH